MVHSSTPPPEARKMLQKSFLTALLPWSPPPWFVPFPYPSPRTSKNVSKIVSDSLTELRKMLQNRALVLVTFGVGTVGTNRVTVRYFIVRELGLVLMPSVLIREARDSVRSGHGFAYKIRCPWLRQTPRQD